jgi:hypothetical protein
MSKHKSIMVLATAALLATAFVGQALATDVPTSAVVLERVFNDCPFSTLTVVNNYPTLISIDDVKIAVCSSSFANRHAWRFSQDGSTPQEFSNNDGFRYGADVTVSGTGEAEAGLNLAPWWSADVDGVFNIRTTDGEIACFGGRLPFYSFTGSQGLTYTKGETVHMEIEYQPNGLSSAAPGTIEYRIEIGGTPYTSGPIAFDEGNPAEDPPHGLWGILTPAYAGGHFQFFLGEGPDDAGVTVDWENITFVDLGTVIATENETWSGVKALYR